MTEETPPTGKRTVGRLGRWALATGTVGLLGLLVPAVIGRFRPAVLEHPSFPQVVAPFIMLYALFLIGFYILGTFGPWKPLLALASMGVGALATTVFSQSSLPLQTLLRPFQLLGSDGNVAISLTAFVFFASFFLVVATTATLLRALTVGRALYTSRAIAMLFIVDVIAVLVTIF